MPCKPLESIGRLAFLASCLSVLVVAPPVVCQVADPPEKVEPGQHDHMHMGAHFMNLTMGEEKCAPQYTYQAGPLSPGHWPGVCTTGKMQAPVDIENPQKLPIGALLKFAYQPADLDVINDCNRYRILVRFPDNKWLKIGKRPYFLTELHFREPGENAVNGKRPPMSVQLVHLDAETAQVIVEVPVVAGKENRAMKALLEHVPAAGKENKVPGVQIDAKDFLPADRSFYRVPGSLSIPICNEGATWYVMKNAIEFSPAQIAAYTKYYHNTARPLQPSNGRPMTESE